MHISISHTAKHKLEEKPQTAWHHQRQRSSAADFRDEAGHHPVVRKRWE